MIGATVGTLLVVSSTVVLVSLMATGHTHDGGGFTVLAMALVGGGWAWFCALRDAGKPAVPRQVVTTDSTGLYGPTVAVDAPSSSPWRTVAVILAMLAVAMIGFTVVMSFLDDYLFGRAHLAAAVVTLMVIVMAAVFGTAARRLIRTTGRGAHIRR